MALGFSLFIFWCVLSGKGDAFHLALGAASAAATAWAARRLWRLNPEMTPLPLRAWPRWPGYLAWLALQVVISSAQVAWIVLQPRLPISPRLVRFRRRLPHPMAYLTLSSSITLTPGTVVVDFEGGEYTVHALTEEGARGLFDGGSEGEMPRRVAALFGAEDA